MLLCGMMEKFGELLLTHRVLRMKQNVGSLLTLFLSLTIGILVSSRNLFSLYFLYEAVFFLLRKSN